MSQESARSAKKTKEEPTPQVSKKRPLEPAVAATPEPEEPKTTAGSKRLRRKREIIEDDE